MKTPVATTERGLSRVRPEMPCPEVQPFARDEPKPTSAPATHTRAQPIVVGSGCIVSGSQVRESLLFTGVKAHSYSELRQVVALPYVTVNRHARLRNVVIDSGVEIPRGLVVGDLDLVPIYRRK